MQQRKKFYDNTPIWSYNAIWNFILTLRSRGKTFSFLSRALRRAQKYGEKTLIVRRYRAEAKKAKDKLYCDDWLKIWNLDDKTIKFDGYKAFCKKGDKWFNFCEITYLAQVKAWRGSRESNIFTVVFDEFTTTPEKYKFYRGNEVEDFLDIVASVRGVHDIRVFFLGNKESVTNPYFSYFNIPIPEDNFEGLRRIAPEFVVECYNTLADGQKTTATERFNNSLKGTRYGKYLTTGTYKRGITEIANLPKNARLLFQFNFDLPCSVYTLKGTYFIKSGINEDLPVFCNYARNYRRCVILRASDKGIFETFANAYKFGRVKYIDKKAGEAFEPVKRFLQFK